VDAVQERELYRSHYHRRPQVQQAAAGRAPLFRTILQALGAPRGRLLDVGCGGGDFLALAGRAGWQVHGIELAPDTATRAAEVSGAKVIASSLEEAVPADAPFACITLINVLDQLADPLEALRRCLGWLEPGGTLFARLPNGRLHTVVMRLADRIPGLRSGLLELTPLHPWVLPPACAVTIARRAGYHHARVRSSRALAVAGTGALRRGCRTLLCLLPPSPVLTPSMELWAQGPAPL
jgi:SAM-dependent methyltransferase